MMARQRFTLLGIILMVILVLSAGGILAHEGREVGEYEIVFGWRVEPAITGYPNGPEVFIRPSSDQEDETEIAAPDVSLQVEVTFGPAARTLDLRPAFGETGHFIADLIPTLPGDYQFRVFGTIGDLAIDERFDSADGGFSGVEPAEDIMFPEPDPVITALLERIAALEAEVAALREG